MRSAPDAVRQLALNKAPEPACQTQDSHTSRRVRVVPRAVPDGRQTDGYRRSMTVPNPGDRIEHWLLTDDSPIARQMHGGRVEEWDPEAESEYDPEWQAAWEADPVGQFRRRFGTRIVDALLAHWNPGHNGLRDDRVPA